MFMNNIEKLDFSKLQKEWPIFSCCQLYWEYLQPTVTTGHSIFLACYQVILIMLTLQMLVYKLVWVTMRDEWCESEVSQMRWTESALTVLKQHITVKLCWHFKEELLSGWATSGNLTFSAFFKVMAQRQHCFPMQSQICAYNWLQRM